MAVMNVISWMSMQTLSHLGAMNSLYPFHKFKLFRHNYDVSVNIAEYLHDFRA